MIVKIRELDWQLIGAALALSVIGILLIMSALYYADSAFQQNYFLKQILWFGFALAVFLIVINLPVRLYDFGAYFLYALAIILLAAVLIVGTSRMGAMRWFSFGSINFAPADLAKLAIVFVLARYLAYSKLAPISKRRLALTALMIMVPMMLILKQPDLGTSLVFPVVLLALWFWSGLRPIYLLLILTPFNSLVAATHWIAWAIYLGILFLFLFLLRPGWVFSSFIVVANMVTGTILPLLWNRLAGYQQQRILTFLDPGNDPRGAGYQIIQSKIAIGSGGILGKGFLQGSQTRLDFLPERHTDFIFSVLGEEFGLWGALIVVGLFAFIFIKAVRIAARCRSRFMSNIVIGAPAILMLQFIVKVGITLGIMPVTGLRFPILSYGST